MKCEIVGADKLIKKLKENKKLDLVQETVKKNGVQMQRNTVSNAVFTRGYSTGQTKRSIHGKISNEGLTYTEGPTTNYAPYVEFGTRKMTAQPFVKPAFNEQVPIFKSDMKKLMK